MISIRGLKIPVYGNKDELFSLWNGATIRAVTKRENEEFFNYSERLSTPERRLHRLSENEYRELPADIRAEHAMFLTTEFLKDSTLRRK